MTEDSSTSAGRRDRRNLRALALARRNDDVEAERRAMASLLEPYWNWCRAVAYPRLPAGRDQGGGAEEVAQDVMERLVEALERKASFDVPFHAVVAKNVEWAIIDYRRKQMREKAKPADPVTLPEVAIEDGPSDLAEAESFDRLIEGVPPRDRALLADRILRDKSTREIAHARNMSESSVDTALSRALKKLRGGNVRKPGPSTE